MSNAPCRLRSQSPWQLRLCAPATKVTVTHNIIIATFMKQPLPAATGPLTPHVVLSTATAPSTETGLLKEY